MHCKFEKNISVTAYLASRFEVATYCARYVAYCCCSLLQATPRRGMSQQSSQQGSLLIQCTVPAEYLGLVRASVGNELVHIHVRPVGVPRREAVKRV